MSKASVEDVSLQNDRLVSSKRRKLVPSASSSIQTVPRDNNDAEERKQMHDRRNEGRRSSSSHNAERQKKIASIYANVIKLSNENRITQKNAWDLNLIDYIDDVIKQPEKDSGDTNFQMASTTLDASVKIYGNRVDDTLTTGYRVLESLCHHAPEKEVKDSQKTSKKLGVVKTLESNHQALLLESYDVMFDVDPLFQVMSRKLDEQGSGGMLLQNLGMHNGLRLILDSNSTIDIPLSLPDSEQPLPLLDIKRTIPVGSVYPFFSSDRPLSELLNMALCPAIDDLLNDAVCAGVSINYSFDPFCALNNTAEGDPSEQSNSMSAADVALSLDLDLSDHSSTAVVDVDVPVVALSSSSIERKDALSVMSPSNLSMHADQQASVDVMCIQDVSMGCGPCIEHEDILLDGIIDDSDRMVVVTDGCEDPLKSLPCCTLDVSPSQSSTVTASQGQDTVDVHPQFNLSDDESDRDEQKDMSLEKSVRQSLIALCDIPLDSLDEKANADSRSSVLKELTRVGSGRPSVVLQKERNSTDPMFTIEKAILESGDNDFYFINPNILRKLNRTKTSVQQKNGQSSSSSKPKAVKNRTKSKATSLDFGSFLLSQSPPDPSLSPKLGKPIEICLSESVLRIDPSTLLLSNEQTPHEIIREYLSLHAYPQFQLRRYTRSGGSLVPLDVTVERGVIDRGWCGSGSELQEEMVCAADVRGYNFVNPLDLNGVVYGVDRQQLPMEYSGLDGKGECLLNDGIDATGGDDVNEDLDAYSGQNVQKTNGKEKVVVSIGEGCDDVLFTEAISSDLQIVSTPPLTRESILVYGQSPIIESNGETDLTPDQPGDHVHDHSLYVADFEAPNVEALSSDMKQDAGMDEDAGRLSMNKLLAANRKVEVIQVNYAKTAKRVNVQLLKEAMWKCIEPQLLSTSSLIHFSSLIESLAPKMSADVSVQFYFICLLHLANEHSLMLQYDPDNPFKDVLISYF